MAGHREIINGNVCFLDYADGEGEAAVDGRIWRWDFHEWVGPTFLRTDGNPRANQNPSKKVWAAFTRWHKKYKRAKK